MDEHWSTNMECWNLNTAICEALINTDWTVQNKCMDKEIHTAQFKHSMLTCRKPSTVLYRSNPTHSAHWLLHSNTIACVYNCIFTVFNNKANQHLICLWEGSNLQRKSRYPKALLQVLGNGGERLSSSDFSDQGHTAGADPWWIAQHPLQALAVMETAVASLRYCVFTFMFDGGLR